MFKCENLPRTNSTKYETQNILVKFQQNEHNPLNSVKVTLHLGKENKEVTTFKRLLKSKLQNLESTA